MAVSTTCTLLTRTCKYETQCVLALTLYLVVILFRTPRGSLTKRLGKWHIQLNQGFELIVFRALMTGCHAETTSRREENMETKSLPSLFNNQDHFDKAYKVFCARSAKFKTYCDWVDGVFSEAVVGRLQVTLDGEEELRVMGVGSGSGEMDCLMLEQLKRRFPLINNRVVDPSQKLLVQYKAFAQTKAHQLHGVKFDFRQQTIEQYQEAGYVTKFHFISAVHSMYFVDNFDSSVMYLYDLLIPGGALLVILRQENNGWQRFLDRFPQLYGRACCHLQVTSRDLLNLLDRRGIPYTQYHQPTSCDITKCFDEASEEGSLLVDFLTQTVHFKEAAAEDEQRSMMEYLASSDCSERKNEAILLNIPRDAVVIIKQQEFN
ncbi:histamine N-methyltransferase-like isoform X1 [Patiria miniata]|uniref:Histamine N-methyltransferase n=1 Tax=Patiria miniata TaxID=46514 RepID=A0A914AZJ2_PATMI|nr:histamine N-methyltransferase-like isoform X1 [Patiria miniata]